MLRRVVKHGRVEAVYLRMEDASYPAVKETVDRLMPLLPGWCTKVTFEILSLDGGAVCQVSVHDDYRDAHVNIDPHWLTVSPEQRFEYLLHEFVHILVGPLQSLAWRLAKRCDGDDSGAGIAATELRRAIEMAVCDTTTTLLEVMR